MSRRAEIEAEIRGLTEGEKVAFLLERLTEARPSDDQAIALVEAGWPVTRKGARIVVALSSGRIQTKDALLLAAGSPYMGDSAPRSYIKRRKKLLSELEIASVCGIGWRLVNADAFGWP